MVTLDAVETVGTLCEPHAIEGGCGGNGQRRDPPRAGTQKRESAPATKGGAPGQPHPLGGRNDSSRNRRSYPLRCFSGVLAGETNQLLAPSFNIFPPTFEDATKTK